MIRQPLPKNPAKRTLIIFGLCVVAIYLVLPQLGSFRLSWSLLLDSQPGWIAAAIGATLLTYLAAAATYYFLAFRPLNYGQLVIVQLAAMFVNKLLPAGVGALGSNYAYLRHQRHNAAQAGTIVAVNNTLGIVGHVTIFIITLLFFRSHIMGLTLHRPSALILIVIALAFVASFIFLRLHTRVARQLHGVQKQLLNYARHPWRLATGLSTSICLTLCNLVCLICCAQALGQHLAFYIVLLVFSLGVSAATVTPTPGGLGGFEAGLAAGFIAYHVPAPSALAIALLYRLVSYWLPLIFGVMAFVYAEQRRLFSS